MAETILKCKNLHKKIGKKEILKGVSLEVNEGDTLYKGESLGIVGPNGAGKTTTIKLILGLQGITSGEVNINGYDIKKDFTKAIRRVGAIIENPDLYMYLTGYENLKLVANMYKGITKERIMEVVKLVKLENRINDKVSKYSLGMRQRLGVAQAILHNPNLLVLDEPTNGLDPEGIKEMRDLLKVLAKQGMAIFISSHNLAEMETLCNKVCIIQNGEIIETNDISVIRTTNEAHYRIVVDNTEKIAEIISVPTEMKEKEEFTIIAEREQVPNIVKTLVENNIKVYEVNEEKLSLEDAFLKKTGGNTID